MDTIKNSESVYLNPGNMAISSFPKTVGYLVIANGFHVGVYEKPQEDHLANMKATFGWEWKDA